MDGEDRDWGAHGSFMAFSDMTDVRSIAGPYFQIGRICTNEVNRHV